ncbi:MAG TPA: hypothetical protein GX709_05015 [Clostridiales bacterium]|nr:hypothetical protein [Clostridiales bacterium]
MKRNKKLILFIAVILLLVISLVACKPSTTQDGDKDGSDTDNSVIMPYPDDKETDNEVLQGDIYERWA